MHYAPYASENKRNLSGVHSWVEGSAELDALLTWVLCFLEGMLEL